MSKPKVDLPSIDTQHAFIPFDESGSMSAGDAQKDLDIARPLGIASHQPRLTSESFWLPDPEEPSINLYITDGEDNAKTQEESRCYLYKTVLWQDHGIAPKGPTKLEICDMKNIPLRQRIKWVLSGAVHPIVLFNEARFRELAVKELGPEYATKPFPWPHDEDTTGRIFDTVCEEFSPYYESDEHYNRHVTRIFNRVLMWSFQFEAGEFDSCKGELKEFPEPLKTFGPPRKLHIMDLQFEITPEMKETFRKATEAYLQNQEAQSSSEMT